jgi:hypothetical protein
MKQQVDQHPSERVFQEGDQVFLHLQPYKKKYLKAQGHHKLAPKFYGPYQIVMREKLSMAKGKPQQTGMTVEINSIPTYAIQTNV